MLPRNPGPVVCAHSEDLGGHGNAAEAPSSGARSSVSFPEILRRRFTAVKIPSPIHLNSFLTVSLFPEGGSRWWGVTVIPGILYNNSIIYPYNAFID